MVGGFEDEFADAQCGVRPGDFLEVPPPFVPECRALFKGEFDGLGHFLVLLDDGTKVEPGDEFGIALLLAGNDLVDNHRAAGGDGLLNRRAAGFADDEVMAHQQLRHLVGPAENVHAVAKIAGAFDELGAQIGVATGGDGEMDIFECEQAVNGLAGLFSAGVDDVEDAARLVAERRGQRLRVVGKNGIHRKAERLDVFLRDAVFDQNIGGGIVGDAEVIAWRAEPSGVDGDGIGDDGDEFEGAFVTMKNLFDDVAVNRVGGNNAVRLGFVQDFFQHDLEPREASELFLDEGIFQHRINAAPEAGRILNHAEIGFAGKGVEHAVAVGKEVEDFRARFFIQKFDGVTEAAGGSVVSVTEPGRQD